MNKLEITIAGKPGTGKSTASKVIAHALEHSGKFCNIVVTDELPPKVTGQLPRSVITAMLVSTVKL